MRIGRTFLLLVAISTAGVQVFGCQYIAGVAGLEANGGAAGDGGAGGGTGGAGGSSTYCMSNADCPMDGICFGPMGMPGKCSACGGLPPQPSSPPPCASAGCDTCDGETCVTRCEAAGDCPGNLELDAFVRPARLMCLGQCNGITVTCNGGNPCEVFCESGGCQNLVLQCGNLGACKLGCKPGTCMGARIECGENSCLATCDMPIPITQTCKGSCDCKKQTCQ